MKEYMAVLQCVKLFDGISENQLMPMLACMGAKLQRYKKDAFVLSVGDKPEHIGIVLEGGVQIIKEDEEGGRLLLTAITSGGFFAEALCCADIKESPVGVIASEDSTIMLLKFSKLPHTCPNSCEFHTRLIRNMLFILAQKNLMLQSRLDIIGKRTLRRKILGYLETLVSTQGRANITIPFNREELADFLCVDRSALSHELSRMKSEGIIDYYKNNFRLL